MGWSWPRDAKPYDSDGSTQRANDYITQMRKEHEQRVDSLVSIIESVQEIHVPYPQNTPMPTRSGTAKGAGRRGHAPPGRPPHRGRIFRHSSHSTGRGSHDQITCQQPA